MPCVLGIGVAEAVGEEGGEGDVFLAEEALLRQLAGREHVQHGGDGAGGGDLDGAVEPPADEPAVDLAGVGLLHEAAVLASAGGDEDDHHILQGGGQGVFQNVLQHLAPVAQAKVVQQRLHDGGMAGIADGLVVERPHLALQRLAQGAEPAGGVEGLVGDAIKGEFLALFQCRHLGHVAVHNGLAGLDIFVDHPVRAPG